LTDRGRRDAVAVGRQLAAWVTPVDLVLCSPALRTRQTWEGAVEGGARAEHVEFPRELYDGDLPDLMELLRSAPDPVRSLLVVGHGPAVPELVHELVDPATSEAAALAELDDSYPTSGLARLDLEGAWSALTGHGARLEAYAVPRG
jgi:phosphohistidine phosphatase